MGSLTNTAANSCAKIGPAAEPHFASICRFPPLVLCNNCWWRIHTRSFPLRGTKHRFHGTLELSARGVDVSSPRTPNERRDSSLNQNALKLRHSFFGRSPKINSRPGIERDQVDLR